MRAPSVIFVALCLCLAAHNPVVAKDCKFKKLKDRSTKESFRGTKPSTIFKEYRPVRIGALAFARDETDYLLYFVYLRDGSPRFSVTMDTPLIVALESGEVLTLFPRVETRAMRLIPPVLRRKMVLYAFYSISRNDVELLATSPVARIKVNYLKKRGVRGSERYEAEKPKRRARAMQNARCILEGNPDPSPILWKIKMA